MIDEMKKKIKEKTILKGMVIGEEDKEAVILYQETRVYIEKSEIGGEEKEYKIHSILGSDIEFVIIKEGNGKIYGSRKEALNIRKEASKTLKNGSKTKGRILLVKNNYLIIESMGEEILVPVRKCISTWCEDLNEEFSPGQAVTVNIIDKDTLDVTLFDGEKELDWDEKLHKVGNEYVGIVKSIIEKGVFVTVEKRLVLCRQVTWSVPPKSGDTVVVEIENVDAKKQRTWGFIKRVVKRSN